MTSINLQSCGSYPKTDDTNLARTQLNCCGDGDCDHSSTCKKCDHHDGGCVHPDGKGTCERPSFSDRAQAMTACLESKCPEDKCDITLNDGKFYFKCTK